MIQKRNLEQWETWRHCDIKSSMVSGWHLCWLCVRWPWLSALLGTGSTFPLCWTALNWCRNTKVLGCFWPSSWLVMSHIIPAECSKANPGQQGHDLPKIIPWAIGKLSFRLQSQRSFLKGSGFNIYRLDVGRRNYLTSLSRNRYWVVAVIFSDIFWGKIHFLKIW